MPHYRLTGHITYQPHDPSSPPLTIPFICGVRQQWSSPISADTLINNLYVTHRLTRHYDSAYTLYSYQAQWHF